MTQVDTLLALEGGVTLELAPGSIPTSQAMVGRVMAVCFPTPLGAMREGAGARNAAG